MSSTVTESVRRFIDKIDDRVHHAYFSDPVGWRSDILAIIVDIEKEVSANGGDWAFDYCLGYAWFNMPEHKFEDYQKAKSFLLRSITANVDFFESRYSLLALEFEYGNYQESKRLSAELKCQYPNYGTFGWKGVKLIEMELCSIIRLCYREIDLGQFDDLIAKYINDFEEEWLLPEPSELVETVVWLDLSKKGLDSISEALTRGAVKLIESLDSKDSFSNQLRVFHDVLKRSQSKNP